MQETPFDMSLTHLDKIIDLASQSMNHFGTGRNLSEFQFYAINMIERVYNRAVSVLAP